MLQLNIEHNLKMNNIFSQKLNLIERKRCMNENTILSWVDKSVFEIQNLYALHDGYDICI
jgi:hypothetical protein